MQGTGGGGFARDEGSLAAGHENTKGRIDAGKFANATNCPSRLSATF